MEALACITEMDNKNIDFKYEKKLLLENINYLIIFDKLKDKEEELIIFVKEENVISSGYYQESFTLDNLQKLNKSFRLFDTIEETIDALKDVIEDNKISIKKDLDILNFMVKFNKAGKGEEEVNLKLSKNSLSIGKIVEGLIEQINEMKKEIKQNKEEIQKNKEEIKQNKEEYKVEIKKINEKLDILLKEKAKADGIDSKIIKKNEELNLISDRIKNTEILKNKKIKYKLLYRGTRDGMNASSFHQKCNSIPNTVSIIQTTKGYKFGGYAEKTWENHDGLTLIKDDKSFVFSIDYMKIYNHVNGTDAILHDNNFGPTFRYCFYLYKDFSKNENSTYYKNDANQHYSGFNRDFELNDGEQYFSVAEIEVFQIILE